MNMTCQTLSWIVKSLQENNMAAKTSPPKLPDLKKKKDEGDYLHKVTFLLLVLFTMYIYIFVYCGSYTKLLL